MMGFGLPIGIGGTATTGGGAVLLDGSESDGTNVLTGGNNLATGWTTLTATLTTNTTAAPDGTTTATSWLDDVGNGRHLVYQQGTVTGSFTASFYAKQNTRRYVQLLIAHSSNGNKVYCYADLQTGSITDSGVVSSGVLTSTAIAAAVNGFYKITLVGSVVGTADASYFQLGLATAGTQGGNTLNFDAPAYDSGAGGSGIYLWRPKLVD